MDIFFDFELTGNAEIDSRITEILLGLRKELRSMLSPYEQKLKEEKVIVFIRMIPGEFGIGYFSDNGISKPLQEELLENINDKFNYERIIHGIANNDRLS
jgi:hypothetical protein